jgi:two-component system sensor histidine kinase EvgS
MGANKTMSTERTQTRVLVVDDEESQRTALAGMIALWGYTVETAADGQEALELTEQLKPDVISMDIRMPRMDGWAALEQIRKTRGSELLPIIAVSASNMAKDEQNVRESFSGYLRKPFTQRQLFSELAQFLPQVKPEPTAQPTPPASAIKPVPVAGAWHGLSTQLRGLETQQWPGLSESLAVNETREFARKLEGLARETNCEPLLAYATALAHYADTYAVDLMEKHLQQFPALIERVEHPGS